MIRIKTVFKTFLLELKLNQVDIVIEKAKEIYNSGLE